MNPYTQQQQYPPPSGAAGYPPPAPGAGGYNIPPPTSSAGPYGAPPTGYGPPPTGYGGYPPQQAAAPPGYASYPPAMGLGGVPPGMGRPQESYASPSGSAPPPVYNTNPNYNNKPPAHGPTFDTEAQQAASYAAAFVDKKVRAGFVKKVFVLVALQLAFTIGIASVFLFVVPVNEYVAGKNICTTSRSGTETCYRAAPEGEWVFYASWALTLVTLIALMCSQTLRRKHPWNYISMIVFTGVMSVQVGCICAWWSLSVVLTAVAVTAAAVLGLTLAAVFIPWDITKRGNVLAMAGMVVFFIALVTFLVGFFYVNKWWYLVLSVVFALLFSAYLVYDIQMVLGNKKYSCSPDDFVFASVQIYLDIIMLFLQLLSIIGFASN